MKAGDRVTWTHQSKRGFCGLTLRSWEGILTEDVTDEKQYFFIRRNRKLYHVHKSLIRPIGEKGHLTELVMGKET